MKHVISFLLVPVLLAACREEAVGPTLPPSPQPPSNVTATAAPNRHIQLSWTDNANNENGNRIERRTGSGGSYSLAATVAMNVVAFVDSVPAPGTNYFYRVAAFNEGGISAYSGSASARSAIESTETVAKDYEAPDNPASYAHLLYGASDYTIELSYSSLTQAWFYFWEAGNTTSFVWEFSPLAVADLNLVTLDTVQAAVFYARGDSSLQNILGADNGENAVRRSVGTILLARKAQMKDIVFVLKLVGVNYPFMTVRYFVLNVN